MTIYIEHFGLAERPFTLVPDPDFLFWSEAHRRAYTMLQFGLLNRAPITLITGEVGAGKTTLLQHFLREIEDDVRVGLVSNAQGGRGDMLRWVLMAFDQRPVPGADYVDLHGQFQDFLIEEYAAGRRTILIFDEAQHLGREALEELRMLTNINSGKDELLQLVLIGQPELRDTVHRPDLSQFAQRVASSFHLARMNEATVRDYIAHRMERAGAPRTIFTDDACAAIYKATNGVPRLVNQLCDFGLVYAFSAEEQEVSAAMIAQVLEDGVFYTAELARKVPVLQLARDVSKD